MGSIIIHYTCLQIPHSRVLGPGAHQVPRAQADKQHLTNTTTPLLRSWRDASSAEEGGEALVSLCAVLLVARTLDDALVEVAALPDPLACNLRVMNHRFVRLQGTLARVSGCSVH